MGDLADYLGQPNTVRPYMGGAVRSHVDDDGFPKIIICPLCSGRGYTIGHVMDGCACSGSGVILKSREEEVKKMLENRNIK